VPGPRDAERDGPLLREKGLSKSESEVSMGLVIREGGEEAGSLNLSKRWVRVSRFASSSAMVGAPGMEAASRAVIGVLSKGVLPVDSCSLCFSCTGLNTGTEMAEAGCDLF